MINYIIIKSYSWFGKVARRTKKPDYWIECTENGFILYRKRGIFSPSQKVMKWGKVAIINACMFDCFTYHSRALTLVDFDQNAITVHDDVVGWQEFLKFLKNNFKDFNANNLEVVNSCFPWTVSLPCWDHNDTVENLELYGAENYIEIVWEKDKSIFLRVESKEKALVKKLKRLIQWKHFEHDRVISESRKEMLDVLEKLLKGNAINDDIVSQSLKYSNDYLLDNIVIAFQSPLTEHKAVSSWAEVSQISISAIKEGWEPDYYNLKLNN